MRKYHHLEAAFSLKFRENGAEFWNFFGGISHTTAASEECTCCCCSAAMCSDDAMTLRGPASDGILFEEELCATRARICIITLP